MGWDGLLTVTGTKGQGLDCCYRNFHLLKIIYMPGMLGKIEILEVGEEGIAEPYHGQQGNGERQFFTLEYSTLA